MLLSQGLTAVWLQRVFGPKTHSLTRRHRPLPSHFNPPPRHVMCSYNSIQGVPTCGSKGLLTTVLRDLWKWEGFVVVRS